MTRTRGRALNGLPWRTGLSILAVLNLGDHRGSPYVESMIDTLARRVSSPLMGGTSGPCVDNSFRCAEDYVLGVPRRGMS